MTPAVSVVIVNLNRCDLLQACLKAVSAQTFRDFEVIVVDNGSTDGSVAFLREALWRPLAAKKNLKSMRHALLSQEGSNILDAAKAHAGKHSPPQPRRGGRDIKKTIAQHPYDGSGRGGVDQETEFFLANTTPSARADVASRLFLFRAATPPRLRRGILSRFLKIGAPLNLRVVLLPENKGFAGGCNAGILAARGRYIATLNNDAEPEPGWLEALVSAMEFDPRVGMCASKILLHRDRGRIDKAGHLMYLDGLNHGRGSGELDRGQYDTPCEVLFPDGAAALYRRVMLDEIGLFDESFFAYGDDADLGLRGRLAGWTCRYLPTAVVYHIHSATAGEFSALKAFLIERNRLFVAVKLFPLRLLVVTPIFTVLRFAFHAYGALFLIGSSGEFAARLTRSQLAFAMLRAYWSAAKHLPQMWRLRSQVRRSPRLRDSDFLALLLRHRIGVRNLTLA